MSKIVSTKKYNAVFLAVILVAGTITLFSPSFMTTASAQSELYYGMDNNNYKSQYGKDNYKSEDDVIVKKINCNNINVNVNGLELDGLPPFLGNLLASDGQDGYGGASSYGSGESYGEKSRSNHDFKFVCINNNNNTVVVVNETIPEPETCEECFTTILTEEELNDLIQGTVLFNTLDDICNFIDTNFENESQRLFLSQYLFNAANEVGLSEEITTILDCLEEIYGVDFPRP